MCIVLTSQANSEHGDTATFRKEILHLQLSLLTAGFQWAELSTLLQAESEDPSWKLFNRIVELAGWLAVGENQPGVLTPCLCTDVSISNEISNRSARPLTRSTSMNYNILHSTYL